MKRSVQVLLIAVCLVGIAVPLYAQDAGLTLEALSVKIEAMVELVTSMSDRVNSFEQRLAIIEATDTPTPTTTPTETPTPTPTEPPTPTPTPTPNSPTASITGRMNVRAGPGTNYPVVGQAAAGDQYIISGKNPAGGWWQIIYGGQYAWIYSPLVTATNPEIVQVATFIPTPPPTPIPTATPIPPPPAPAPTQPPPSGQAYSLTNNGNCPRNDRQTYFEGKMYDRNNNLLNNVCLHIAFSGPRNIKCSGCGKPTGHWGFSPFGGPASSGTYVEIWVVNCPAGGWDGPRTNTKDFSNLSPLSNKWTRTINESVACTDITFKQN
jgi:hypothetical protein